MNKDDKAAIYDFLVEMLKQRGDPPNKRDALLDYLRETSANDPAGKLLHRLSDLVDKDIVNDYTNHLAVRVEIAHHKISTLEDRIAKLEDKHRDQPVQWRVIQGIA